MIKSTSTPSFECRQFQTSTTVQMNKAQAEKLDLFIASRKSPPTAIRELGQGLNAAAKSVALFQSGASQVPEPKFHEEGENGPSFLVFAFQAVIVVCVNAEMADIINETIRPDGISDAERKAIAPNIWSFGEKLQTCMSRTDNWTSGGKNTANKDWEDRNRHD